MLYWTQIPFVRIIIPFVFGIILQKYLLLDLSIYWSLAFCLLLLVQYIFFSKNYKLRYHFGVNVFIAFLLTGAAIHKHFNSRTHTSLISNNVEIKWEGLVIEKSSTNGKTNKLICKVNKYFDSTQYQKSFKVIAYVPDTSKLDVGDVFLTQSIFKEIPKNTIPNIFDYSEFLANRKIYYQTYFKGNKLIEKQKSLTSFAAQLRNSIVKIYEKAGLTDQQLGVIIALTLGNKSYLDYETRSYFAKAGAMHILAVSGLHVGIVFLIFSTLLRVLPSKKGFNFLRASILLLIVWGFALLTGFSPSVQRAGCMFSIIIIASAINRSTNILNSIFGSAFLILLINPNSIFEVGFQLSYSAVLGIVLIYPQLYPLIATKNKFVNWWLGIMVVSIAAQLSTLPLTLYYFHQFPNWFLLVNFVVIPAAFILVGGSVLLCVCFLLFNSFFYIDLLIKFFLNVLLSAVKGIDSLPYSYTADIWIDLTTSFFISLLVIFLIAWLSDQKSIWLKLTIFSAIAIGLIEIKEKFSQVNQDFIAIYPSKYNQQIIAKIEGQKANLFITGDSLTQFEKSQIEQHLKSINIRTISFSMTSSSLESALFLDKKTLLFYQNRMLIAFTNQKSSMGRLKKIEDLDIIFIPKNSFLSNDLDLNVSKVKFSNVDDFSLRTIKENMQNHSDSVIIIDRKF